MQPAGRPLLGSPGSDLAVSRLHLGPDRRHVHRFRYSAPARSADSASALAGHHRQYERWLRSGGIVDLESALVGAMAGTFSSGAPTGHSSSSPAKRAWAMATSSCSAPSAPGSAGRSCPATILIAALAGLLYAMITSLRGQRRPRKPIAFGPVPGRCRMGLPGEP